MMPVQRSCISITLRTSHAIHFVQNNAGHGQAAQSRTMIYSTPVVVVIWNAAIRTTYNAPSAPNFGRTYIGHRQPPCRYISVRTSHPRTLLLANEPIDFWRVRKVPPRTHTLLAAYLNSYPDTYSAAKKLHTPEMLRLVDSEERV